jgi:hypothetical protein
LGYFGYKKNTETWKLWFMYLRHWFHDLGPKASNVRWEIGVTAPAFPRPFRPAELQTWCFKWRPAGMWCSNGFPGWDPTPKGPNPLLSVS